MSSRFDLRALKGKTTHIVLHGSLRHGERDSVHELVLEEDDGVGVSNGGLHTSERKRSQRDASSLSFLPRPALPRPALPCPAPPVRPPTSPSLGRRSLLQRHRGNEKFDSPSTDPCSPQRSRARRPSVQGWIRTNWRNIVSVVVRPSSRQGGKGVGERVGGEERWKGGKVER